MIKNNQKDIDKIYNKLSSSIIVLFDIYNYLELSESEFEILVKKIIAKILNTTISKIDKQQYIKKIVQYLDNYVKQIIENPENTAKIINNYIDKKIFISTILEDNVLELKKINKFLDKNECVITPDLCIKLIKNNNKLYPPTHSGNVVLFH